MGSYEDELFMHHIADYLDEQDAYDDEWDDDEYYDDEEYF